MRNIILVAGEAAPSKEFLLERLADLRQRAPGAPDLAQAIRGPRRPSRLDRGRAGADGRLRAHRRAAPSLFG